MRFFAWILVMGFLIFSIKKISEKTNICAYSWDKLRESKKIRAGKKEQDNCSGKIKNTQGLYTSVFKY